MTSTQALEVIRDWGVWVPLAVLSAYILVTNTSSPQRLRMVSPLVHSLVLGILWPVVLTMVAAIRGFTIALVRREEARHGELNRRRNPRRPVVGH
jgi:hypothetical protein